MAEEPLAMWRVLVVEDESDLSSSLAYALRANGYEAKIAGTGHAAIEALESFRPDLVLLDLMLPDMSGLEICRKLRGTPSEEQPIVVILSARAQEIDRVVGFEIGADDYVAKPFSVRELMLRIDARLRSRQRISEARSGQVARVDEATNRFFQLRNLRIDESAHRVFVDDDEVHVSALEMRILVYLFQSPGHMRTRRELLTEVWGYHPDVESRTVDTHIKRLRDKLGAGADLLQTVRGVGFRLANAEPAAEPAGNETVEEGPAALLPARRRPPTQQSPKPL
jgi:two-component system phosphate regulon response regulator PhoB